jgi:hypothetical protein
MIHIYTYKDKQTGEEGWMFASKRVPDYLLDNFFIVAENEISFMTLVPHDVPGAEDATDDDVFCLPFADDGDLPNLIESLKSINHSLRAEIVQLRAEADLCDIDREASRGVLDNLALRNTELMKQVQDLKEQKESMEKWRCFRPSYIHCAFMKGYTWTGGGQ